MLGERLLHALVGAAAALPLPRNSDDCTVLSASTAADALRSDINLVARQALAMDRSQLIAVRAMMGAYCERPNVTAKVSVCANSLNFTLEKLR